MFDKYGRNIDYLRISVTDKCNMQCVYCMPDKGIDFLPNSQILTFEEILRVVTAAAATGITKIKITGGEPLLRKDIAGLIRQIKQINGIQSVTLTTNGLLFKEMGRELTTAGLDGVNFSLDSRDASAFHAITGVDEYTTVYKSICYAIEAGFRTKINCVPIHRYNTEEATTVAELSLLHPLSVRFIELMPIGTGKKFSSIKNEIILQMLTKKYGQPKPSLTVHGNGPAVYYDFPGFKGNIGFISALTQCFCSSCNRMRLTASGILKSCLYHNKGMDLKKLLQSGISDKQLKEVIKGVIFNKPYRHYFNDFPCETIETKKMVQIGG